MAAPAENQIRRQRFALVMVLSLGTVLLTIAMGQNNGVRALALLLQGLAFLIALFAAHDHTWRREGTAGAALVALATICVFAGMGSLHDDVRVIISLFFAVATPALMVRGLIRLLRDRGVTPQAVFGALALYLQLGLIFALAAAALAIAEGGAFFSGIENAALSDFVYFSFTTMSTTGYGDLTPATSTGRSLAVLEMLVGQIYLVTVVGLIIGNMGRTRRAG